VIEEGSREGRIFCGGLGMRLSDIPNPSEPMVPVGYRPSLAVMRDYAHSATRSLLCPRVKGDSIKSTSSVRRDVSNDFVFSGGGKKIDLLASDIDDGRSPSSTRAWPRTWHASEGGAAVPQG